MITIGLTGSIGMGKSTVSMMFGECGAAVWSADDAVHRLYAADGPAVPLVAASFPGVVVDGGIDRQSLAKQVLGRPKALKKLEAIVHPLVGADRENFLRAAAHARAPAAVLDIPLLFENGSEVFFDVVVVVSAPADVQRDRVLARPGMTEEKLKAIMAEQMPDEEKRQKANYVISTNQPIEKTRVEVKKAWDEIIAQYST